MTREIGATGKLVFELERDEDDDLVLVKIEGSEESEGPGILSDVEAAKEEWDTVGARMFEKDWFEPGAGKAFRVAGRIRYFRTDTIDGTDYDSEFECEWTERVR